MEYSLARKREVENTQNFIRGNLSPSFFLFLLFRLHFLKGVNYLFCAPNCIAFSTHTLHTRISVRV